MTPTLKLLNLGCGSRFHPSWTNVDFVAAHPSIMPHDLRTGVPFSDAAFDVVYHSHVLEHFAKAEALPFLRECRRVLKPGGVLRVAVPDLERIARTYLQMLEAAVRGEPGAEHNYDWILLEMYDQTVRERSGGDMKVYLSQEQIPNREFVLQRLGAEAASHLERSRESAKEEPPPAKRHPAPFRKLRLLSALLRNPAFRREWTARRLLGAEYALLEMGRFRRGGEIHRWMYDRHGLGRLLRDAGLVDPRPVGPAESRIVGWADYCLDTEKNGTVYKPDSLYMEATKP